MKLLFAALLAALLVVTGALVAVMAVVAWLDSPRVMEADGSRGLRGPDQD